MIPRSKISIDQARFLIILTAQIFGHQLLAGDFFFSFDTQPDGNGAYSQTVTAKNVAGTPTLTVTGSSFRDTGGAASFIAFDGQDWLGSATNQLPGHSMAWNPTSVGNSFTLDFGGIPAEDIVIRFDTRSVGDFPPSAFTALEYNTGDGYKQIGIPVPAISTTSGFQTWTMDLSAVTAIENKHTLSLRWSIPNIQGTTSLRVDNLQATFILGNAPPPPNPLVRFSPPGAFCNFGTYGVSPENPSGSKIAFTRFPVTPTVSSKTLDAEVWIANADGSEMTKLANVSNIDLHNGARCIWVDDDSLAYWDNSTTKVRNTNGTLEYSQAGFPGDANFGHNIIVFQADAGNPDDGVNVLDTATGTFTNLVVQSDFIPFVAMMDGSDDPSQWRFTHPQFSPDGTKASVEIQTGPSGSIYLFSFGADGNDLVFFGKKPMHGKWWDDESFYGHDDQVNDGRPNDLSLRRWTRTGGFMETLAPPGNHIGISPSKLRYASETWYGSDPVTFSLYLKGATSGAMIDSSNYVNLIWTLGGHLNPSFSRDGRRVYFNRAVTANRLECYYYDIYLAEGGILAENVTIAQALPSEVELDISGTTRSDLNYLLESSTNLAPAGWSVVGSRVEGGSWTLLPGNPDLYVTRSGTGGAGIAVELASEKKRFFRVKRQY